MMSSDHFVLKDEPEQANGVTLSRREVKFAMPQADFGKLTSILEVNCRRINHGHKTSLVSSIYFDDFRMSSCHESLDGVSKRSKVRWRWYNDGDSEGRFFFEI